MSTTNDISNGSSNDASNDRERHSSYLTEAMNDKKQMSKDLKELLTEKFIKNVAFYHIIHDLKERENDFLETDGPLCKKFVSICINNMDNLPRIIGFKGPILKMRRYTLKLYGIWDSIHLGKVSDMQLVFIKQVFMLQ